MIFLGLGSNMGNRLQNLTSAIDLLLKNGVEVMKRSSIYETDAWGYTHQASFLNMVIAGNTKFNPQELLGICLDIEAQLGRERIEKWGPRIIDIDILLFDDLILHTDNLIIPHPLFASRKFVLEPLSEIASDIIDPLSKKSIAELNQQCLDELEVKKIS